MKNVTLLADWELNILNLVLEHKTNYALDFDQPFSYLILQQNVLLIICNIGQENLKNRKKGFTYIYIFLEINNLA